MEKVTMKFLASRIALLVAAAALTSFVAAADAAEPANGAASEVTTNGASARIQFDAPHFEFGKVTAGQPIRHTFIVSNAGDATLVISDVKGTCGCTTAGAWTKEIEPGKTGVVPININSAFLHGNVQKEAVVTSNDKSRPTVMLELKGTIWQPIEVHPPVAYLHMVPGVSNPPAIVRISNKTDQPLTLAPPESATKLFTAQLKTGEPGKEFELWVWAVPPLPPGNTPGSITVKTSSTDMPVLTIQALAITPRPPIVATPQEIVLTPGANAQAAVRNVLIQSTIPQPLILSDASVNATGVEVQIKELQAARRFSLTLTFPPGFQVPSDGSLELSVKSNFPQFPVIKIPISQAAAGPGLAGKKS